MEMAQRHSVSALIIESSFVSIRETMPPLFRYSIPPFLMKYDFATVEKIKTLDLPILVIHSSEDEMIAFENGERLFQSATEPKSWLETSGGHNGFVDKFLDYESEILVFLGK